MENVLVIEDMPGLAGRYLQHWNSRWETGTDYKQAYSVVIGNVSKEI